VHVYADTWNALRRSCDQAVAAVLKVRREGLPAEWRRPRWDDPATIVADKPGHWRIVERGSLWWTLETRLHEGWVRFKAKLGNWHNIPDDAVFKTLKLTRRKHGNGWKYSVSICVQGMPEAGGTAFADRGAVALDWGHREHGHPNARHGIRAWYWRGDDGREGEILLPAEMRELRDRIDDTLSRIDKTFAARGEHDRNRHAYRKRLQRLRVLTREQDAWLVWETRYEKRVDRMRRRLQNLRRETYLQAVRDLRKQYKHFVTEDEPGKHHQRNDKEEQSKHRKRQNRDMVARYEFLSICERLGADVITVPSRNTTRECPDCGALAENGPEPDVACPGCGQVEDKDARACRIILRRGLEALANRAANDRDQGAAE
jgi:rubrerythrin